MEMIALVDLLTSSYSKSVSNNKRQMNSHCGIQSDLRPAENNNYKP